MGNKEIHDAILKNYMFWKNKYNLIKASDFTNRDRKIFATNESDLCNHLDKNDVDSEIVSEIGTLGNRIITNALNKIRNGTKEEALKAIEEGLAEYEQFINNNFPDVHSKLSNKFLSAK
jgi:hypothetical protein